MSIIEFLMWIFILASFSLFFIVGFEKIRDYQEETRELMNQSCIEQNLTLDRIDEVCYTFENNRIIKYSIEDIGNRTYHVSKFPIVEVEE